MYFLLTVKLSWKMSVEMYFSNVFEIVELLLSQREKTNNNFCQHVWIFFLFEKNILNSWNCFIRDTFFSWIFFFSFLSKKMLFQILNVFEKKTHNEITFILSTWKTSTLLYKSFLRKHIQLTVFQKKIIWTTRGRKFQ